MANNILFVFEGERTEKLITDNLKVNFFDDSNTIIQCAYCTTIYNLYNTLSKDEDLDLFVLLKGISCNQENLKVFKRDDFAEIYLFFDYDGHTTSADDEKLKSILEFFNEETEFGKLYISYPMVEALKHCSRTIDFKELKVQAKLKIKYKQLANQECEERFINMPIYTREIWVKLIEFHIKKMNYIVVDEYNFPSNNFAQSDIFLKQLEKYINVDSTVAVLSSFPIFIFDYYGVKFISELFTDIIE